jgi:hypothetical protein
MIYSIRQDGQGSSLLDLTNQKQGEMMNKSVGIAGMIMALAIGAQAENMAIGDVIGVDFGPTVNTNSFNVLSANESNHALVNLKGAAMDGVSVTLAGTAFSNNDADEFLGNPPVIYTEDNLTDWVGAVGKGKAASLTITFAGLNNAFTYNLNIGAAFAKNELPNGTVYSACGQSITNKVIAVDPNFFDLKGLTTDGVGNLVITASLKNSGKGTVVPVVSALTLTAAPAVPAVAPAE